MTTAKRHSQGHAQEHPEEQPKKVEELPVAAEHPPVAEEPEKVAKDEAPGLTANLTSFTITVNLSGSVANPANSTTFQAVTPWGKSGICAGFIEAIEQVVGGKGGTPNSGRMGAYFSSQTSNANEVGN